MKNVIIQPRFSSMYLMKYEEYKLHDLSTIIAAVGGSMGLFLGFSCFQCGKDLIERAYRKISDV
jgi:hypothetical protein